MTSEKSHCFYHREEEAKNICGICNKPVCDSCVRKWISLESNPDSLSIYCPLCYYETRYDPNVQTAGLLRILLGIATMLPLIGFLVYTEFWNGYNDVGLLFLLIIYSVMFLFGIGLIINGVKLFTTKIDLKLLNRREENIKTFLQSIDPNIARKVRKKRKTD